MMMVYDFYKHFCLVLPTFNFRMPFFYFFVSIKSSAQLKCNVILYNIIGTSKPQQITMTNTVCNIILYFNFYNSGK